MGECPDWYITIRAARYMGVAPWELVTQPYCWTAWALEAEAAENRAANQKKQKLT